MENKYFKLVRAVHENNLTEVKYLLNTVDTKQLFLKEYHKRRDTLLHYANSAEITRELLCYGAYVNARNMDRRTPLHTAVARGKDVKLIRELLKYGARCKAETCYGDNPLIYAVTNRDRNVEIIKELLEHGAGGINLSIPRKCVICESQGRYLDKHLLECAVDDLECAKILIKHCFIRNIKRNYTKATNLDPYKNCSNHGNLSNFLEGCICEVEQMKTEIIEDDLTLYEIVIEKKKPKNATVKISQILSSMKYPIYNDVISAKIKYGVERAHLFNRLSELHIYTESDKCIQDDKVKKVSLDSDSVYHIAEFLSNNVLLNLILAFQKQCGPRSSSSKNIVEVCEKADKTF